MPAVLLSHHTAGSTTNDSLMTIPAVVAPVGSRMILSCNRGATSTVTGIDSIVDSGGNTWVLDAAACRASTHDLEVWSAPVLTGVSGGVTIDWTSTGSRKAGIISVWTGIGAALATSGASVGGTGSLGTVSNGSDNNPFAATVGAAAGLVIGSFTRAGTATCTPNDTQIGTVITGSGSDRGVTQAYRVAATSAIQEAEALLSASQGWAASAVVYEITEEPPPGGFALSRWVSGVEVSYDLSTWQGGVEAPRSLEVT
jgi:hypothetical protein